MSLIFGFNISCKLVIPGFLKGNLEFILHSVWGEYVDGAFFLYQKLGPVSHVPL